MTEHTCCFTGHRSGKLPWLSEETLSCERFLIRLGMEIRRFILEYNVRHFITGMADGVDLYAAEEVLRLRRATPNLTLECAIPYDGHCRNRNARYQRVLQGADRRTVLQAGYSRDCFLKRNCYMVDQSRFVLAAWSGTGGGTAHTVRYALEHGREVVLVNPRYYVIKNKRDRV